MSSSISSADNKRTNGHHNNNNKKRGQQNSHVRDEFRDDHDDSNNNGFIDDDGANAIEITELNHSMSEDESLGLLSSEDDEDHHSNGGGLLLFTADAASSSSPNQKQRQKRRRRRRNSFDYDEIGDSSFSSSVCSSTKCLTCCMVVILIVAAVATFIPKLPSKDDVDPAYVDYKCPKHIKQALSSYAEFDAIYEEQAKAQDTDNITVFETTFRTSEFDDWGSTYNEVKAAMTPFKSKYYPPNIKTGDNIYESACGIGLNLLMTLEILYETANITDITVYGNEYIEFSTNKANEIFDKMHTDFNLKKGRICMGDSANLFNVPSDSFDLVFSGYISALVDPLNFNAGTQENYDQYYYKLCNATDWQGQKLNELAQKVQDDWFGRWVGEMVRIAKPGAAVIAEQISETYCGHEYDWGGVSKDFWVEGVNRYDWDVDPESIVIEDDQLFQARYHVFMKKNDDDEDSEDD